jgi:type I restriction enzyme, S subunit
VRNALAGLTDIRSLVVAVSTGDPGTLTGSEEFRYIDIASIDRDQKVITNTSLLNIDEAPSRARQLVKAGDVLVSTVRPNLNAVAVVPDDLDGAIASTGFCVLRVEPRLASNRYVFHWVRTSQFVNEMSRLATGASYPAVSDRIILNSQIPAPPAKEQQRIASILDKADAIRRKRQEALNALGKLRRSQFERWFSPLFQANAEDARVPVSSFVKRFEGGINLATSDSATPETRNYILKVSAVTWGDYRPEECKPLPSEYSPPPDHYVREGDLLFSRANTTELVGATVYVFETPPDRVLPDKLWRFVWKEPSRVEPLFVWALFNHPKIRYEIGRRATGTSGSMKNISMDKVLSILVPFPDVQEQRRFANYLRGDRDLKGKMNNAIEEANRLFNCLVERAFRGEL